MTEMSLQEQAQDGQSPSAALNDAGFLAEIRPQMVKFAQLQLNDHHLAEDAVQEALVGAMKNAAAFGGKAALKTWIFAILRNKIADVLRKKQRRAEVSPSQMYRRREEVNEDEDLSELFDERGHWHPETRPLPWQDPEASFKQQQFWLVFETCLNNLPERQAKVFMMREFIGLDSEEICREVELSLSNLHVLLHRARLRLQQCLELRWLKAEEAHA